MTAVRQDSELPTGASFCGKSKRSDAVFSNGFKQFATRRAILCFAGLSE